MSLWGKVVVCFVTSEYCTFYSFILRRMTGTGGRQGLRASTLARRLLPMNIYSSTPIDPRVDLAARCVCVFCHGILHVLELPPACRTLGQENHFRSFKPAPPTHLIPVFYMPSTYNPPPPHQLSFFTYSILSTIFVHFHCQRSEHNVAPPGMY